MLWLSKSYVFKVVWVLKGASILPTPMGFVITLQLFILFGSHGQPGGDTLQRFLLDVHAKHRASKHISKYRPLTFT